MLLFAMDAVDGSGYALAGTIVEAIIAVVTMMKRESRKDDSSAVKKWKEIATAEGKRIETLEEYVKSLLLRDRDNATTIATQAEQIKNRDIRIAQLEKKP